MTSPERHAAVLEALNRRIEQKRASAAGAVGWVREYRDREADGLEGCRRILQRHAPGGAANESQCGFCDDFADTEYSTWPCPDYRDASAGVEDR